MARSLIWFLSVWAALFMGAQAQFWSTTVNTKCAVKTNESNSKD